VGLVDTKRHLPGTDPRRIRKAESIDLETALRALGGADVVSVIGGAGPARLPGIGTVITEAESRGLLDLEEPLRSKVLTFIADTDSLGLSVFALDREPNRALVVDRDTGERRREALETRNPAAADLVETWAQLRPDLRTLISRGVAKVQRSGDAAEAVPGPVLGGVEGQRRGREWDQEVRRAVLDEIFAAVDDGRAPVSPTLLEGEDALVGTLDGSPALTARGAVYAVAARAIMPGSRVLPIRGGRDFELRLLMRPDGRVAVMAYNPGRPAPLTIQLPDSGRAKRFVVNLAGRSFTTALLPG
jgi:hypothetical protein